MLRERLVGAVATAWSVACIAHDLWMGLSTGLRRESPAAGRRFRWPVDWAGTCERCGLAFEDGEAVREFTSGEIRHDFYCERDESPTDVSPPQSEVVWKRIDSVTFRGHTPTSSLGAQMRGSFVEWWVVCQDSDARGRRPNGHGSVDNTMAETMRCAEGVLAVMLKRPC